MIAPLAATLAAAAGVLLWFERRGGDRFTFELAFKGDLKRETAFLAQYGQSVATPIAGLLVAIAHGNDWRSFALVCGPVLATSITCMVLKRGFGRLRPNRENAGRFTGPSWRHENRRESFPSSHSACAFALTVTLVHVWPAAAGVFWALAICTAVLRYALNAHFPSDVVAGAAIGLVLGEFVYRLLETWLR